MPSRPAAGPVPRASTPAFTRFIAGVQILGTVLGIPLGLASGYSIYRANFSPEAKCGALRANIISMLDKNADASTLRLLVRRDVDTFEHSCGSVDPDAVAAFKTLLAKPTAVAAAPKAVKSVKEAKAVRPAKVEMKVESRVEKKADKKVAHAAPAEHAAHARQEAARHEGVRVARVDEKAARAKADGNWLAAVRRALVEHAPVGHAQAAEAPVQPTPAPVAPPMVQPMVRSMGTLPAPAQAAPPLPPATAVVDVPGNPASKNDESHPVPPALIPDVGAQPAK